MTTIRRALLTLALLPALLIVPAAPAASADGTGDDNTAVAVNTEDGASVFRLAFSIRRVANGVIDETNSAYALASCTDCQTVALAFQIVLAHGDVDIAVPENRAVAYNDECAACLTYASATQIVLGFDRPTRFTAEGRQRLHALRRTLRSLEERAPTMAVTELNAAVQAAKAELVAILEQELVEVPARPTDPRGPRTSDDDATGSDGGSTPLTGPPGGGDTTTTTTGTATSAGSSTTTTTANQPASTTTTTEPQATATTSTASTASTAGGS